MSIEALRTFAIIALLFGCGAKGERGKPMWSPELAERLGAFAGGDCVGKTAKDCFGPRGSFSVLLDGGRIDNLSLTMTTTDIEASRAMITDVLRGVVSERIIQGIEARLQPSLKSSESFDMDRVGVSVSVSPKPRELGDEGQPKSLSTSIRLNWYD